MNLVKASVESYRKNIGSFILILFSYLPNLKTNIICQTIPKSLSPYTYKDKHTQRHTHTHHRMNSN